MKRFQNYDKAVLPRTECLKDTVDRFLPFWHDQIVPQLKVLTEQLKQLRQLCLRIVSFYYLLRSFQIGKKVLIAAHGNSIRALVKYLDNVPDNEIVELNIPTGIPLVYELDANLKPVKHYYLADEETVKAAVHAVANQGKAK